MKQLLLAVVMLIVTLSASAQDRAEVWVSRLAAAMRTEGRCEVLFTVDGEEMHFEGSCTLSGERYHLVLPEMEVFGDRTVRYEIDHRRRSITPVAVDPQSRQLFDNPVAAFDFVGTEYRARLVEEQPAYVVIELHSAEEPPMVIRLTLDRQTARPRTIRYEMDGIGFDLLIRDCTIYSEPLAPFAVERYADYERVE